MKNSFFPEKTNRNSFSVHLVSNIQLPATNFIQYLRVFKSFGNFVYFNISLKNSESPTFFNICERRTSFYNITSNYSENKYTVEPVSNSKSLSFVDFELKGIFKDVTLEIECDYQCYENKSKNYLLYDIINAYIVISIIFIAFKMNRSYCYLFILVLVPLLYLSIGYGSLNVGFNTVFEIIAKDFPKRTSLYSSKSIQKYIPSILEFKEYNKEKCKVCDLNTFLPSDSNSSPRDLIVSAYVQKAKNIEAFIRSCRSVNCKATIVIFADSNDYSNTFNDCGAFIIPIKGDCLNGINKKQGYRFKLISLFLNLVPDGTFNRIMYADLYDTIFQGDPFLTNITNKTVIVSDEVFPIKNVTYNKIILSSGELKTFPMELIENKTSLCSGIYLGTAAEIKLIFNIVSNWMPFDLKKLEVNDQAYFTITIYSDFFQSNGIKVISSTVGGIISSVNMFFKKMTNDYPTRYEEDDNSNILVLHHANRMHEYYDKVQNACSKIT